MISIRVSWYQMRDLSATGLSVCFTLNVNLLLWLTHSPLLTCCFFTNTITISDRSCNFLQNCYRLVRKCSEIFILFCSNRSCGWCNFENSFSQSPCHDTAYTVGVNHWVCYDFSKLNSRIKGFKLICSIPRNSCYIVIRITIINGVVDLIIELLVTRYLVNRFLIITLMMVASI